MKRILVLLPLILLVPLVLFLYRQIPNDKTPDNTLKEAFVSQDNQPQNQNQNQGPQQITGQVKAVDVTTPYSTTNPTNEVKVKNKNYQISFSQDAQNPTADKSDETRYSRLPNGIKEEIILSKAPTTPFIVNYTATFSGVKPRFFQNLWHFFDEQGKEQFFIPKPFMIDQKGQKSESINLQINPISATKYQITITPDYSWLTSPDRTYPVIVDPTIEVPNQPIQEIIAKRNQTSKTYSLPNGNFAWEGQLGPMHYKDNPNNSAESWKEIDTRIQPVTDPSSEYGFQNLTNSFKSFFKKNSKDQDTVRYEGGGSYITFTNQDNELGQLSSVEGYAKDNQFVYPGAYDGIDVKYSINTSELLEEFVLTKPRDVSRISQKVHVENAYYQKQDDGVVKFFSTKTNELVWTFPKPKMYEVNERPDKDGLPSRSENFGLHYEIVKEGNDYIVTKVLDQEGKDWLNSPERVYPLVIDTTLDLQVGASADDGRIYGGANFQNNTKWVSGGNSGTNDYESFIRITNVTIPNAATISTVTITFIAVADTSGTTVNTKLHFENADNPAAVSSYADFLARTLTAGTAWNSIAAWTLGSSYTSPNFSAELQTVVNRAGWASGQAVQVFWKNNSSSASAWRSGAAWDDTTYTEPVLHIEYSTAIRFNGLKMQGVQIR